MSKNVLRISQTDHVKWYGPYRMGIRWNFTKLYQTVTKISSAETKMCALWISWKG